MFAPMIRMAFCLALLPVAASAAATRVALAPLSSLTEDSSAAASLEKVIADGIVAVKDVTLVRPADVRQALKKAKRRDLEACDGEGPCVKEIGSLVGADVVVFGVAGGLAEGQVVYLKAIDAKSGLEVGNTTTVLSGTDLVRAAEAKAAAVRLVAPNSYLGTVILKVDVEGAQVFVDGRSVGTSPLAPISATVGTHALRVTHPRYHDFVRFVDVPFERTETLSVNLTEFPVVSDEMRGRAKVEEDRAWYQQGWAVAGFAAVVVVVTTIVVTSLGKEMPRDDEVIVHPPR